MRIEQLLHGYQDGHGRLAGSIYNLSPKDSARVSMMSDWSGYKDPAGKDHSYVTTYYLEDSGYYVIAKSWYAQEMERPGCVWTQSLLIPLTDMTPPFDIRKLQPLFERPKRGEYGAYNKPIEIDDSDKSTVKWEGKKPDRVSLMFILSTVLAGEENFYMKVELDSWWYQQFCLTVLQFLPIEILRRVSLSSGGMHPRKIDENLLTMQFVNNSESISLLSPPWAEKLEESSFNNGLNIVARAMMAGGNDVSALIRIFSNDIGTDGKKYIAICQLIGALYLGVRKDSKVDYKEILSIVIDSFPTIEEGRLVKENYLGRRITDLFCSDDTFLYYISTIDHLEKAVTADQMKLEERIKDLSEERYYGLIKRILTSDVLSAFGRGILNDSYNHLDPNDIEHLNDDEWRGLMSYWGDNRNYLMSNKWMSLGGERFNDVLWRFTRIENDGFLYWEELLKTILVNDVYVDDSIVDKLFTKVEDCTTQVLDYLNTEHELLRYDVLHVRPFREVDKLIDWLGHQRKVTLQVEKLIINYVWPSDYSIKQSDPQVWKWMIENDNGSKAPAFYVFMYEIAWQWSDDAVLRYFYHCFHQVLNELADRTMTDRIWNRMYRYGGNVSLFQEWDRCLKLKKGIVAHLKSQGFSRAVFERFTPDEKINESLVEIYDKMK